MLYTVTMYRTQKKTKLYKFGYYVDAKNVAWKSDGIKNLMEFRHRAANTLMDPDANKFNNIVVWVELNVEAGMGPMVGSVGTTFSEINIIAQEENRGSSSPPTVSFKSPKLLSVNMSMPPPAELSAGNMRPCQVLSFGFDKATASWQDD